MTFSITILKIMTFSMILNMFSLIWHFHKTFFTSTLTKTLSIMILSIAIHSIIILSITILISQNNNTEHEIFLSYCYNHNDIRHNNTQNNENQLDVKYICGCHIQKTFFMSTLTKTLSIMTLGIAIHSRMMLSITILTGQNNDNEHRYILSYNDIQHKDT